MKKLLTLFSLSMLACLSSNAQLALTQINNEPIAGDLIAMPRFDSILPLPRNTGPGQSWDFSAIVQNNAPYSSITYTPASSVAASSLFPTATIAAKIATNQYEFYRSITSPTQQFELLGNSFPGRTDLFQDPKIVNTWPMAFGNTSIDSYSGTITGPVTTQISGTFTSSAVGTGTLMLPGGYPLNNVLQVKSVNYSVEVQSAPTPTAVYSYTTTTYDYYHASSKFPIITVFSEASNITIVNPYTWVFYNKPLALALLENNSEFIFDIYPNPVHNKFNIGLNNAQHEKCIAEICDATGKLVVSQVLGNDPVIKEEISVPGLQAGIYFLKIRLGNASAFKKVIID